mmetsp:Transcript_36584/g.84814  ORF Transcript_36584/g.84814 Transcript_36584/m.84814 type:complete len:144 (-) Transcript_36584:1018-1449(-)
MGQGVGKRHAELPVLEQHQRFAGKRRERRQAAQKPGHQQQLHEFVRLPTEPLQRHADQQAANQIDQQGAKRKPGPARVEQQAGLPARQSAQRGADRDRQRIHAALAPATPQRASASSSATRASTQCAPSGVYSFFQNGAWVFK